MNSRVEVAGHETADREPPTAYRLRSDRWAVRASTGVLAALAFVTTACGGNGAPSPEKVAVQWRTAEFNGDFSTAWDLAAPEWRGNQDKAASVAADEEIRRNRPPRLPGDELAAVKVTRTVEDDTQKEDFVFVYLRVTDKEGDAHDEVVTLRRVDGDWRVAKWEP